VDFKVFLSSDALSDLERIVGYIALDNAVAAERMGDQLLDAAFSLTIFPSAVAWCRSLSGPIT
jgi:plasmid stabilization system protein ParE